MQSTNKAEKRKHDSSDEPGCEKQSKIEPQFKYDKTFSVLENLVANRDIGCVWKMIRGLLDVLNADAILKKQADPIWAAVKQSHKNRHVDNSIVPLEITKFLSKNHVDAINKKILEKRQQKSEQASSDADEAFISENAHIKDIMSVEVARELSAKKRWQICMKIRKQKEDKEKNRQNGDEGDEAFIVENLHLGIVSYTLN